MVEPKQILAARQVINDIYVDDKVKDYIVDLVCATREPEHLQDRRERLDSTRRLAARDDLVALCRQSLRLPARPRLRHAAGRQEHRLDVLRHRVAITYEAEAEEKTSETIIQKILG